MSDEKTISLDDHNAKLAETRRKYEAKAADAAEKALSSLFSTIGVDSKEELKDALEAAKAASEASKTDIEKLQAAYDKSQKDLEAARAQFEGTVKAWHGDKIRAEVVAAAGKAHKPDQVFTLVRDDFSVDKDGNVVASSGKPVAEHVDAWLNDNPHHLPPQGGAGGGSAPPAGGGEQGHDLSTPEGRQANMAERLGR